MIKFIYMSRIHSNQSFNYLLKAFINFSQTIGYVYENLQDYNATKKRRVLKVFEDMIADMESNEKLIITCFYRTILVQSA